MSAKEPKREFKPGDKIGVSLHRGDSTRTDSYGRPLITGVRLEIDESQATTVRRIFADYAAGDSI